MKKIQILMVLTAIFSVATVMGTQQAMAGTTATTGSVIIDPVCELTAPGTLNFANGDPLNNGAGVGVGETAAFVLSNVNGNLDSIVSVSGSNWYASIGDGTDDVMSVGNTKYDDVSGLIAAKTALTGALAGITTVNAGSTQDTFWDLEIELDLAPSHTGAASQDITFDFSCAGA